MFYFFIVSFKFSIELYRFPRAHRKIELYSPTSGRGGRKRGGCTVIVINKDNGSHSAHKQRQTEREGGGGKEGRGARDRGEAGEGGREGAGTGTGRRRRGVLCYA